MTQKQILAELKPWLKAYQDIEAAFADWEKLAPISDLDKSPLWKGYYVLFDLYTDQLAKCLGGDASTWLPWYIYDNRCGKNKFSVRSLSNSATDSICNLKDLAVLIHASQR